MMGKMIATCGHEIKHVSWALDIHDETRDCQPCVSCIVVCPKCRRSYHRWGVVIKEERTDWRRVGVKERKSVKKTQVSAGKRGKRALR